MMKCRYCGQKATIEQIDTSVNKRTMQIEYLVCCRCGNETQTSHESICGAMKAWDTEQKR